jgi:hypothetical protein
MLARNLNDSFKKKITLVPSLQPNLAISSGGRLPVWLHHKIEKEKKRKEKKKALELQLTNTLFSPGYIYSQK